MWDSNTCSSDILCSIRAAPRRKNKVPSVAIVGVLCMCAVLTESIKIIAASINNPRNNKVRSLLCSVDGLTILIIFAHQQISFPQTHPDVLSVER